jgi:hypothetical protein
MAASETFSNVGHEKWGRIKHKVHDKTGITIDSDQGEGERHGVDLKWDYQAAAETLTITLVSRAFWDPSESEIMAQVKAAVDSA